MELIRLKKGEYLNINHPIVVTIGQFDGLHLAHLLLLKKTIELSQKRNLKSAIFTFDPHPDFILNKDKTNTYVTPFDEKVKLLRQIGIDYMIVIEFNKEVAQMLPISFVEDILIANGVKEVVVGFDFSFGQKGLGKAHMIEELSKGRIKCHIVDEMKHENQKIGTSFIKTLLQNGRVREVKDLMGRFYKITGKVVHGNQVGRTINFPTANFSINSSFAKLHPGVYVVRVSIDDKKYLGIANLGTNPSFNKVDNMVFETHIFDFNQDIYDKIIDVELIDFIRDEIKFSSKEAFLKQILKDTEYAKMICVQLNLF